MVRFLSTLNTVCSVQQIVLYVDCRVYIATVWDCAESQLIVTLLTHMRSAVVLLLRGTSSSCLFQRFVLLTKLLQANTHINILSRERILHFIGNCLVL
jgi:hypothetical protein